MVWLLQIQYRLRILMWVLRVAIVVFLLIPGSIPALILTALTYIMTLFDPNMVLRGQLMDLYSDYFLVLPLWLRSTLTITLVTLFLYIYVKIELRKIGNSKLFETVKLKLSRIYEKYLKFPKLEFEEFNYN